MVIDTHAHIGIIDDFACYGEMLIHSMKKYKINHALVSNMEGFEFTQDLKNIINKHDNKQLVINKKAVKFAKDNPKKISILLWCRPNLETCDDAFKRFYLKNKKYIVGLKFHPYYSNIKMDDPKVEPYLKFAKKYKLPILVHTAEDVNSDPYHTLMAAKKYPTVKFIMGHMNMGTNHLECAHYIASCKNLYGDLAWVDPIMIKEILKIIPSTKLLFGTDSPIDGVDTYNHPFYLYMRKNMRKDIGKEAFENIMYRNAIKVFNLQF